MEIYGIMSIETRFQNMSKEELIQELTRVHEEKFFQELIEAKNRAEKNELLLNEAQAIAHVGNWELDLINNKLQWSDEIFRIFGCKPKEFEETYEAFIEFVHPDDREMVNNAYAEHLKNKQSYDLVHRILLKNNKIKYVSEKCRTKFDENGKAIRSLGIVNDITELVKRENELIQAKERAQESEIHLKESQEMAKLGSWELAVETGIFSFTDNFYKIFKTSAEEMGGYQMSVKDYTDKFVHPDDAHLVAEESKRAIETDDPNYAKYIEHKIIYKDGSTGYIGVRVFIKKDSTGKTIKAYGVNQDITERKINEQKLIEAKTKAEESDRLKSAFLANMSHEIRTPMNAILGFLNLMKDTSLEEEERLSFIDIINESGERLLNTIDDILEISRIETGDLNIKLENVDISKIMESQFNFFNPQAIEKGIDFRIAKQITGIEALVKTDKYKLEAILINLIKNAIKFTSEGSIEIGNYIEKDKFFLYVKDTGQGIPKDKLEIIFDAFVQVDIALSRRYEGSGIGLSIVKSYVGALGGDIKIESQVKKGSTFIVSLPYIPAE